MRYPVPWQPVKGPSSSGCGSRYRSPNPGQCLSGPGCGFGNPAVINKIDLPAADPERVRHEIEDVIGLDASEAVLASAKAGIGIEEILEQIVEKVPAPTGDVAAPLQALIFDSILILMGSYPPGADCQWHGQAWRYHPDDVQWQDL
ncbi:hypothetical protein [Streptococcus sp.]|uniref:hypothetical protein n=1 Tax=Streptococcus sp. TaxID=1306 RepID=UPI00391DF8CF